MAKPKKIENMSALDYLYEKLSQLVKKIETSSRGKISKRDLLIYSLIIILILSVRFGGVIGAFTFILAVATIWNIKITQRLLRRAETSFVINTIDRMMDYVNQNTTELGIDAVVSYTVSKLASIHKINKELSDVLQEALIAWGSKAKYKEFADRLKQSRSRNSTKTGKDHS